MKEIDLNNLNKKEHFHVPDGYFDQLPKHIMGAIRQERVHKRNFILTAAAAITLAVISTTLVLKYHTDDTPQKNLVIEETTISLREEMENQIADYYTAELTQNDYYNY